MTKVTDDAREKGPEDAPVYLSTSEASAWANGYNSALAAPAPKVTEDDREKALPTVDGLYVLNLDGSVIDADLLIVDSNHFIPIRYYEGQRYEYNEGDSFDLLAPATKPVAPTRYGLIAAIDQLLVGIASAAGERGYSRSVARQAQWLTDSLLASDLFEARAQVQAEVIDWIESRYFGGEPQTLEWRLKLAREHFGLEAGR